MALDPFAWSLSKIFEDVGFGCMAYFGPAPLNYLPLGEVICQITFVPCCFTPNLSSVCPKNLMVRELDYCHGLLNRSLQVYSRLIQFYLKLCGRVVVHMKTRTWCNSPPFHVESLRCEEDEEVRQVVDNIETM